MHIYAWDEIPPRVSGSSVEMPKKERASFLVWRKGYLYKLNCLRGRRHLLFKKQTNENNRTGLVFQDAYIHADGAAMFLPIFFERREKNCVPCVYIVIYMYVCGAL